MQRYLSITANVEGEDLGRASVQIAKAIADAGEPPRGVRVRVRGQVAPMTEMFQSLAVGLVLSVVVILVMLTGYFQSFKLGLVSIGAVPGVVCGVAIILLATGTTLNIESFMGSIMCIGVSVSNSVLLSTFMDDHWRAGATVQQAAIEGANDRLRPILMTALAMILGTVPMALALEEGSEMTAPLGRAVIGGLVVSTFATLLVVPAIFTMLMGDKKKVSPSIDPDDPQSRHYDSGHEHSLQAAHGGPRPDEPAMPKADDLAEPGKLLMRKRQLASSVGRTFLGGIALTLAARPGPDAASNNARGAKLRESVPEVHVVKPELRNLTCTVDQPGFVEAYEQTAIYSKVSGFIKKYYVDIGQQVKKDDLMVEIFVPELDEDHQQKVAQVDRTSTRKMVVVAESKLQTAIAQLAEAKANVERYQADIVRWESEVRRLTQMVEQRVVDREVLDETQKQLSSSRATRDAALAAVAARDAARVSAQADVGKAKIDVEPPRPKSRWPRRMSAAPRPCWPIRK